ncbi:MAG: hypothetical protein JXQ73_04510 [Phycisphaerae bacterium]|nr:hypothetical protein [Phycisphaerae bacterium]
MKLTEQQRELVEKNLGLVNVHIRRYVRLPHGSNRDREYADLFQEGSLALMEAARNHDPKRHGSFAAYAIPRIHHVISVALYERFSTVRFPVISVKRAKERREQTRGSSRYKPEPALARTYNFDDDAVQCRDVSENRHRPAGRAAQVGRCWRGGEIDLAARVRAMYEAAVREAADRLCAAPRGRKDRRHLIRRFVEERLLIPDPEAWTSKRQFARDFKSSLGRILNCEEALMVEIRSILDADDAFQVLLKLARQEDDGMDAVIKPEMASRLEQAALDGFARRFACAEADRQATVLRELLRATMGSLTGFARRLFAKLDDRARARFLAMVKDSDLSRTVENAKRPARDSSPSSA